MGRSGGWNVVKWSTAIHTIGQCLPNLPRPGRNMSGRWQVQHFHAFEVPHDASQNATLSRNFRKPGTVVGVALLDCCVLEPNLRVVMV